MYKNNYNWIYTLLKVAGILIFGLIFIAICVYLINYVQENGIIKNINANDTILMFVGLLATFIVIVNYQQVQEAKDYVKNELRRVKSKISEIERMQENIEIINVSHIGQSIIESSKQFPINMLIKEKDGYNCLNFFQESNDYLIEDGIIRLPVVGYEINTNEKNNAISVNLKILKDTETISVNILNLCHLGCNGFYVEDTAKVNNAIIYWYNNNKKKQVETTVCRS